MALLTEEQLNELEKKFPDNGGYCGYCSEFVSVGDPMHRITPISYGGRGVECKRRGDY